MASEENTEEQRQRILETACAHLWQHDEDLLRVADICRETGLSSTVVFEHFYSRQHLIDAGYLAIYREITTAVVTQLREAMVDITTPEELIGTLRAFLNDPRHVNQPENRRFMLLRVITAALGRAPMRRDYAALQRQYVDGLAGCFAELVERGVIGNLLSPRQLATVFEVAVLMRSFTDFDATTRHDSDVLDMLSTVFRCSARDAVA